MYILGIAGYGHDCTATLLKDGELIAAAEEEQFTRIKHQEGFPFKAIQYCLKEARISEKEIDYIVYANDLWGISGFKKTFHYAKNFVKEPVYSSGFVIRELYSKAWIAFFMNTVKNNG